LVAAADRVAAKKRGQVAVARLPSAGAVGVREA
jgi:hypothetical protein